MEDRKDPGLSLQQEHGCIARALRAVATLQVIVKVDKGTGHLSLNSEAWVWVAV